MIRISNVAGRTTGITITPADAANILENRNINNKPLSQAKVKEYVGKMVSGKWNALPEGFTFVFDLQGRCLSAQHRLTASVKADFTFENATIDVVDRDMWLDSTVEKRSDKDKFFMRFGDALTKDAANCVRKVAGQVPFLSIPGRPTVQTSGCSTPRDFDEVVMDKIGNIIEDLLKITKANKKKLAAQQLTALGCFAFVGVLGKEEVIRLAMEDVTSEKNSLVCWVNTYKSHILGGVDFDVNAKSTALI